MRQFKNNSRRLLQACCAAASLFILCFGAFYFQNHPKTEKSVTEIYNLKEQIMDLDWKNTEPEELNNYLTQTPEMYVGAYLSVMDEEDREALCEVVPVMRAIVTSGTLVYDEEEEAFVPTGEEQACTYEESCIQAYEEAIADGALAWTDADEETEAEAAVTENMIEVEGEQKLLTVNQSDAEITMETSSLRGAQDRGKWRFPGSGQDGSESWFYISNADRTVTYRYELSGMAGYDITDDLETGLIGKTISCRCVCVNGSVADFPKPNLKEVKVYKTGVNSGRSWWYRDRAKTDLVDSTYNAQAYEGNNGYIAQEQVLCGLSIIFDNVTAPTGYHYDANNVHVYAYGTSRPAYAWNYMYNSDGTVSDYYASSRDRALRSENRFIFNKLWENLYGKVEVWDKDTGQWKTKMYDRGDFSRISNESSFTGTEMTMNCDLMFLSGTRLVDDLHPERTVCEAEQSEVVLNLVPNEYTVTADANWGELYDYPQGTGWTNITHFPVQYQTNTYDNIGGLQPKRDGYIFAGWYTDRNGGVQVYDVNGYRVNDTGYWYDGKWDRTEGATVYAHWVPSSWVVLDANWGELYDYINTNSWTNVTSFYAEYGKNYYDDISRTVPKRDGFVFDGWYIDAGNTENGRDHGEMVWDKDGHAVEGSFWQNGKWNYTNGNVTAFAHWIKAEDVKMSSLTVNPNGGTWNGSTAVQTFTQNQNTTKTIPNPTWAGHEFKGWTKSNSSNSFCGMLSNGVYTFGTVAGVTDVLTAEWEEDRASVTINPNGGTWNGSSGVQTFSQACHSTKDIADPVRTGYTFTGWAKSDPFYGALSGRTYTFASAKDKTDVLTATWQANSSTLKVDPNGGTWNGSGSVQTFTQEYGTTKEIPDPVMPGYTFKGWAKSNPMNGTLSGKTYTFGDASGKTDTLTAMWQVNYYKVTLHAGNGIESVSGAGEYAYGTTVTIDAAVLRGYHWGTWTGTYDTQTKRYAFTMPARDVDMTADAEANTYTLHFDPNSGAEVMHLDDVTVAYDENVMLPDASGAYVKYTLDGNNITDDVLRGDIDLHAVGLEMDNTDDPEALKESENPEALKESENLEALEETENLEELERQEEPEPEAEAELETAEEEPAADQKAYASVYTGWVLEDEKENFVPQWLPGQEINVAQLVETAGVTDTDGAVVTVYASWDDCPWIVATNLYYTLEQAQQGVITDSEILNHATASDREDGSPIEAGFHENGTSFSIPDYQASDFTQFLRGGSCTENLTVVDSAGSIYCKQITVYVVDTTPADARTERTTRFIDEKYYGSSYERGGLLDDSIWKTDTAYVSALRTAFGNLENDAPVETYMINGETRRKIREYVDAHGFGDNKEAGALQEMYDRYLVPNCVR